MERKKIKLPDPPTVGYGAATSVFSLLPAIPPSHLTTPLPHESQDEDDAIKTDDNVRAAPLEPVRPQQVSLTDSDDDAPLLTQKKPAANEPEQKEKSFLRCFVSSAEAEMARQCRHTLASGLVTRQNTLSARMRLKATYRRLKTIFSAVYRQSMT